MSYERTAESDLEIIFEELDIQSVGNGYIDLICPKENIGSFIDNMNSLGIKITGFTWWCHATNSHRACGMGGPKEKFGNGYYSEIYMESVIKFNSNEEFRKFLLEEYPNSDEYKPCYTPAFWIDFE